MATYNYRVVVDVDINTSGANQGANQTEAYFRKIEQQARDSQKRMSDYESQYARERYNNKVADYERQLAQTRQFAQEEIRLETQKNQQIANERRNYHQRRFAEQKAAAEREIAIERDKWRQIMQLQSTMTLQRSASINTAARSGQAGAGTVSGSFTPTNFSTQQSRIDDLLNTGRGNAAGRTPTLGGSTSARGDIQVLDTYIDRTNEMTRATSRGSNALGMWGQAFKGAFIGAVAGMSFSVLIENISNVARAIGEAGAESVNAAAKFEVTSRALEVFAGSSARAREELADIGKVARSTAGLDLETAEVGYTRLRALGFEAQRAQGFVKELAEERVLSGASSEALDRIIFNFAQIASGGQKVSQELREILTQMPSLKNAIFDAFGTMNPKKIQSLIDQQGTDVFFDKLTEAMSKQRSASGGLQDSLIKLNNELTESKRAFGEPFLDPLTDGFLSLTETINGNEDALRAWGQTFADVVSGAIETSKDLAKTDSPDVVNSIGGAVFRAFFGGGLTDNLISYGQIGYGYLENRGREKREANPYRKQLTELGQREDFLNVPIGNAPMGRERLRRLGYTSDQIEEYVKQYEASRIDTNPLRAIKEPMQAFSAVGNFSMEGDTFESRLQQAINMRNERQFQGTRRSDEEKRLREAERVRQQELARINSYYDEVRSIREQAFNVEVAQNQENAQRVFEITQKNYSAQIDEVTQQYNRLIELNSDDAAKVYELGVERNTKLRDLDAKRQIEAINFEREQAKRRREELLQANDLSLRDVQSSYTRQIALIQRALDQETISVSAGYAEIRELTERELNITTELIRSKYDLRLSDATLTAQQRVNIEKEMLLEIEDVTEQSMNRLLDLNDKKFNAQAERIKQSAMQTEAIITQLISSYNTIESAFAPSLTRGSGVSRRSLENLLGTNGKEIFESNSAYEAQLRILRERQNLEATELNLQIGLNVRLLEIEKERAIEAERIYIANLNTRRENYLTMAKQATRDGRTTDAEVYTQEAQSLTTRSNERQAALDQVIEGTKQIETAESRRLEDSNRILLNKKSELAVTQEIEEFNFKQVNDLTVINQLTADILAKKKDTEILEIRELNAAKERQQLALTIRNLEIEIEKGDQNADLRIRAELLQHIVDLRNQETDAVIRIGKAQMDFDRQFTYSATRADASVMEFLASQKGITEILSDARIGALTTAYDGLDQVAKSLAKNFGVASKAVEDLISSLLKLGLNYIFRKFMGGGSLFGGNGGQQGGMPNIFGGGSGGGWFSNGTFGGTANWNPMQMFGGDGAPQVNTPFQSPIDRITQTMTPIFRGGSGQLGGNGSFGGTGLSAMLGGFMNPATMAAIAIPLFLDSLRTTNPIKGALQGGLVGFVASLINRSRLRRKEEKVRNQAMLDAFAAIDKLIEGVNNDTIDGGQALSQAEQIRENYLQNMEQLTDKKTRNHALADVSRIDAKIATLKNAIQGQVARRERLEQTVPTFAEGGSLTGYKNNPLGYQEGGQRFGYFPQAGMIASYNERGSEYILDAETTRNVGVYNLDRLRASKGRDTNLRNNLFIPQMAQGGVMTPSPSISNGQSGAGSAGTPSFNVSVKVGIGDLIETIIEAVSQSGDAKTIVAQLTESFKNNGNAELTELIINKAKERGLIK